MRPCPRGMGSIAWIDAVEHVGDCTWNEWHRIGATLIVVALRVALSSYGASAGEKIRYTVVNDVVVNGVLVAKAGDSAVGQVQEAQRGKNGDFSLEYQAADLRVSVDSVYNYCGDTVSVLFDRVEYRRRQGVFGSNADITIKQGQQYAAIVDHPQKICGTTTSEDPPTPGPDVITSGVQP